MLNKLLNTFGTRLISTVVQLATMVLVTNYLGAYGQGAISVLMAGITLILLVCNLGGGGALVYLTPRINTAKLVLPLYAWCLICALIGTGLLYASNMIPGTYAAHVLLLSLLIAGYTIHTNILLGRERVIAHNAAALLQVLAVLTAFGYSVFLGSHSIGTYIWALYLGLGLSYLTVLLMSLRGNRQQKWFGLGSGLKSIATYGVIAQLANIAQFISYRASLFFLEIFYNLDAVGLYSVGLRIAEALWILPKSIGMVLFTRIANTEDKTEAARLSLRLSKVSGFLTCLLVLPLVLVPADLFTWIFGKDFSAAKRIFLLLSPGVASFGLSSVISQYFSGLGKFHINTYAAIIGLAATLVLNFLLVPSYGVEGAAFATMLAYLLLSGYKIMIYLQETGYSLRDLFPNRDDFRQTYEEYKIWKNDR